MIADLAGEHTMPDGRKVQITVVEQAKTETELSAKFEDCFDRVKPLKYISAGNSMITNNAACSHDSAHHNHVPTERNAKQLQAFAKLLVIMHDLNGGEFIPKKRELVYTVVYDRESSRFCLEHRVFTHDFPICFRTQELTQKALEANEQIFKDFYGVWKHY